MLKTRFLRLWFLGSTLLCGPAEAVNYEVYPGSAFYLTQMLDRTKWSFVAGQSNGIYHHPVGFNDLDATQETTYTSHFTNRFAMVEGDMGSGSTTSDVPNLQRMSALGLTPVAAFVNRASSNLATWRQLIRNNAAEGAPSYEMLAPHVIDDNPLGWNDPSYDYARDNMRVPGCIGSGVDAPVYLFVNRDQAYRQSIYDLQEWTVSNGREFNYLLSPNFSYNAALLADTQTTVRALEDNGHEPDVYGIVLYGERPVALTPEKVNVNGVDRAASTITGLAYWLLKHHDGEPGTLDLSAIHGETTHGGGVMQPTLATPSQIVPLSSTASRTFTLRLNNTSPWLDYAGVLRARAHGSVADWTITFTMGTRDVTAQVLSADGKLFVGADRWMPGSQHELTMTITPNGSPGPLKLVVEALPHAGIDHALDVLAFESATHGNTPPTLALNTIPQITREALPFGPLWFTCGDAETSSTSLVVSASSSDTLLVPNNNISLGQNGVQRWLRVVPATGRWGITNISVTVSDSVSSVTKSFALTVDRTTVLPVVKADNPLNLELDESWQGSVRPGPVNQAVWDATVTRPNSVNLAADFELAGLRITNPGGDVTINGTSTLSIGISGIDMASSTRNLTLHAPLALDESAEWKIATSRLVRVTQDITGSGGIAKSGGGRLELLGDDTFTGQLSTHGGEMVKSGSGAQSSTMVTDNARFRASHSGAFGMGDLSVGAANNYTGGIILSGDISVLTEKSVTIAARNSNTDAVSSVSGNNTFGGNVAFGTGGVFYGFSSTGGLLTLSGNFSSKATGNRNFTLRGAGDGRMTGKISDGSGVVGLVKSGSGTWSLAGVHTFSGAVSHQEGTLGVFSPLAKQAVTVYPGAVLTGNGTLGGSVSISGIHSPGDGVGSQSIQGPLSYQDGARIRWEIGGQSPSGDLITAAAVTVASGASIDVVANTPNGTVDFTLPFWREARTWPVLTANSIAGSFTLASGAVDSTGGSSLPYGDFNLVQTPASVSLQWTPAPPFRTWQYVSFGTSWDDPSIAGADQDPDADGWSNANEWITGTDPKKASSRFTATLDQSGLFFNRVEGRSYRIETTANLQDEWTTHAIVPSGSGSVTIPIIPTGEPRRFYRVAVGWNP